jgi:hypothetical protein
MVVSHANLDYKIGIFYQTICSSGEVVNTIDRLIEAHTAEDEP